MMTSALVSQEKARVSTMTVMPEQLNTPIVGRGIRRATTAAPTSAITAPAMTAMIAPVSLVPSAKAMMTNRIRATIEIVVIQTAVADLPVPCIRPTVSAKTKLSGRWIAVASITTGVTLRVGARKGVMLASTTAPRAPVVSAAVGIRRRNAVVFLLSVGVVERLRANLAPL